MAINFRKAFILCCLYINIVCVGGNTKSFKIRRKERDRFSYQHCLNTNACMKGQCQFYNAECVQENCKSCRCVEPYRTFIVNDSSADGGNCTKDENIISESVPGESFRLRPRQNDTFCLTVLEDRSQVVVENCSWSLEMRWMWIKYGINWRLVNVASLQCLEFGLPSGDTSNITMKQCNETKGQNMEIHEKNGLILAKPQSKAKYYLGFSEHGLRYPLGVRQGTTYSLTNKEGDNYHLHNHNITYKGCYRFTNESFMLYLKNKCRKDPCSHPFSAPIYVKYSECKVEWSESTIMNADGKWEKDSRNNGQSLFTIQEGPSSDVKMLQVQQAALQVFNGSLLKLNIICKDKQNVEHETQCLLLKFGLNESKPTQTSTSTSMPKSKATATRTTPKPKPTTPLTSTRTTKLTPTGTPKPTPTRTPLTSTRTTKLTPTPTSKPHEDSKASTTNILAIVISLSLVAVVAVIILAYFMYFRKRNRAKKSPTIQAHVSDSNFSKPVYEEPHRTYETPVPGNQQASPARYEYIDNKGMPKPKLPEIELKYDYAANTEIPRITLPLPEPESERHEQPVATTGYHTLEESQSPQPVATNGYHTLEESQSPQAVPYSTLEEPTVETNPLMPYDVPHSADPEYNVLEETNDTSS